MLDSQSSCVELAVLVCAEKVLPNLWEHLLWNEYWEVVKKTRNYPIF